MQRCPGSGWRVLHSPWTRSRGRRMGHLGFWQDWSLKQIRPELAEPSNPQIAREDSRAFWAGMVLAGGSGATVEG